MAIPFVYRTEEVHNRIAAHIDDLSDALATGSTSSHSAHLVPTAHTSDLTDQTPDAPQSQLTVHFDTNPSSSTSLTNTPIYSNETSDTETTPPPTPFEEEWVLDITADMTRRLSLLPTQPSGPTLPHLPTEIQLEIFSYLDKIDSCCLGLTSPRTYAIYQSIFGTKLPLSTRRSGPNKLERAWDGVGKKQMCTHCGVARCELYKHIESWMPDHLEYCNMLQNFGPRGEGQGHGAGQGQAHRNSCYRVKPSKPRRCGKHPVRTTSLHQDDAGGSTAMAAFANAL